MGNWRFDFIANDLARRDAEHLVDVKWIPLPALTLSVARNIATLHAEGRVSKDEPRHTLIVSSSIPLVAQSWIKDEFDMEVWDRAHLKAIAVSDQQGALGDFIEKSDTWYNETRARGRVATAQPLVDMGSTEAPTAEIESNAFDHAILSDPNESTVSASDLCRELKKIPPGAPGAKAFEEITDRIFSYLFPHDLLRTELTSRRTRDGLNIYDLVFQIRNLSEFWTNLARDLRSRVLIVECKNYGKPIRAMQIYTTERYLSAAALRSIALIITRKRPHHSAIAAASGALRESGKLMLILDEEDLCTMLHMRELQLETDDSQIKGNDPSEFINSRLHQFLARLPR